MGWAERCRGGLEWLRRTPRTGDPLRDEQGRFVAGLLLIALACLVVLALWIVPRLLDPLLSALLAREEGHPADLT